MDKWQEIVERHDYFLSRENLEGSRYCYSLFGIECGKGWYDMIENLVCQIEQHCMDRDIFPMPEVHQIKEKFGALRFYIEAGDDEIYRFIDLAEKKSWKVCELCGSTDGVKHTAGWIMTRCKKCMDEYIDKVGYTGGVY